MYLSFMIKAYRFTQLGPLDQWNLWNLLSPYLLYSVSIPLRRFGYAFFLLFGTPILALEPPIIDFVYSTSQARSAQPILQELSQYTPPNSVIRTIVLQEPATTNIPWTNESTTITIVSGDSALKAILAIYNHSSSHSKALSTKRPTQPFVFCHVYSQQLVQAALKQQFTGIYHADYSQKVFELMHRFAKGVKRGYLLTDPSFIPDTTGQDSTLVLYAHTQGEWQAKFLQLQKHANMIYLGAILPNSNWNAQSVLPFVTQHTQIPTAAICSTMVPLAFISWIPSLTEQGKQAGLYVQHILDGRPIAQLPLQQGYEGELIVNLDIAQKLQIILDRPLYRYASLFKNNQYIQRVAP
jgi:hypothetical protein